MTFEYGVIIQGVFQFKLLEKTGELCKEIVKITR